MEVDERGGASPAQGKGKASAAPGKAAAAATAQERRASFPSGLVAPPPPPSSLAAASAPPVSRGRGEWRSSDGRVYSGEYEVDANGTKVPSGEGRMTWPNGDVYTGAFLRGKPEGFGRLKSGGAAEASGRKRPVWSAGKFSDGLLHGVGVSMLVEGKEWYEGEFRQGRIEGLGTFVDKTAGTVTSGEFKAGVVGGFAVRGFENGDSFCGEFVKGVSSGVGAYHFAGRVEDGENGEPAEPSAIGGMYEGEFTGDGANGCGVKQVAGLRYTGQLRHDKFDGLGVLQFTSGDVYKGAFSGDMMHGRGVYQFKNHDWCAGTFEQDELQGPGEFHFANGDRYEGRFVDDEMHGEGTYWFADTGDKYEGLFESGKLGPRGKKTFADGSRLEGGFLDGAAHGECLFTVSPQHPTQAWKQVKVSYDNGVLVPSAAASSIGAPEQVRGAMPKEPESDRDVEDGPLGPVAAHQRPLFHDPDSPGPG
jgi:hypothetical protein